jgi:hypothetical protein
MKFLFEVYHCLHHQGLMSSIFDYEDYNSFRSAEASLPENTALTLIIEGVRPEVKRATSFMSKQ